MKIFALTIIAAIVAAGAIYKMSTTATESIPSEVLSSWVHWKMKFGRSYGTSTEESQRLAVFYQNYQKINAHNANPAETSTVSLNKFADLSSREFAAQYTGRMQKSQNFSKSKPVVLSEVNTPDSVDWVDAGAVGAVKDQGQCGSCWAFSAVGSTESANYLQKSMTSVPSYSEQQLVDCCQGARWQSEGCNGGFEDIAMNYIGENPVMFESAYPYTAEDGVCQYDSAQGHGTVSKMNQVPANNVSQLKAAIANQPVSIAVEADQYVFQLYTSGTITSASCGQSTDHAVIAVGYGNGFFKVRNSWGADWGMNGYLQISDSSSSVCGILSDPAYPTA